MSRSSTITVVFTDIVGSTELLGRLGERAWSDVVFRHFSMLRNNLANFDGTEIKNTGDGLMAVFGSAAQAVECTVAMLDAAPTVRVNESPVGIRIGISAGEATEEANDWFGTPVVEAARLCSLAGSNEIWSTALVRTLARSHTKANFVDLGPQSLKGFDGPIAVCRIHPASGPRTSMFAAVDADRKLGARLVAQLDYWESLPSLQTMRAGIFEALAPAIGQTVCDIGCGTGSELELVARVVGPGGRVIGVDPSTTMITEARRRMVDAGLPVELIETDGRATGLDDGCCDAVRIERVVQHVGDAAGLLGEAVRITRPGGRIVIADSDWGSLMIHPGNRDVVRRIKAAFEQGPMAEPWAGRTLHGALIDAGLTHVTSEMFPVFAQGDVWPALAPMMARMVEGRWLSHSESDQLHADLQAAASRGDQIYAFTMFVASGRRV